MTNKIDDTFIEKQDIIHFNTDHNASIDTLLDPKATLLNLIKPMKGDVEHSIKSFLARPYMFSNFHFNAADPRNAELSAFYIYSSLMSLPYYSNKLKGFYGFRATTNVKLQVNGNRFQQGRLILVFNPVSQNSGAHLTTNLSLMRRTQLPHASLDINTDTECNLVIPYVSDRPFYEFGPQGNGYGGHVSTCIYSRLNVGPSTETFVDCSMWVYFTDVELFWPSNVNPQSGESGSRYKNPQREVIGPNKPVASFIGRLSNATSILSKIPLLSSVAQPTSWALRIASDAASAMGWCKPQSCERSALAVRQGSNWPNATGYDYNDNMGLFEDNKVRALNNIGGSGSDQMSLKYVLSIPTWYTSFNFDTSMSTGSQLKDIRASPEQFYENTSYTNPNVFMTTPLKYFSTMFQYWRGTIRFKIIAVKTEFHTGRVRVSFEPSYGITVLDQDQVYLYSEILDLKLASEWIIDVPFTSSALYAPVSAKGPIGAGDFRGCEVHFRVVNELRAPETVSNFVEFNVEVSAGEDFEFAVPTMSTDYIPVNYVNTNSTFDPASRSLVAAAQPDGVYSQGAFEEGNSQILTGSFPIANAPHFGATILPSEYCMGERITSLKQLAMRPSFLSFGTIDNRCLFIDAPRSFRKSSNGGFVAWNYNENATFMDRIQCCYAFYRGGVVVKAAGTGIPLLSQITNTRVSYQNTIAAHVRMSNSWDAFNTSHQPIPTRNMIPAQAQFSSETQGSSDIVIPHYCSRPVRRTGETDGTGNDDVNIWLVQDDSRILTFYGATGASLPAPNTIGNTRRQVFLSAADDYQCGFFVGTPPMAPITFGPIVYSDDLNNIKQQGAIWA